MKTSKRTRSPRKLIEACVRSNVPKKLADKFLKRLYRKKFFIEKLRAKPTYRIRVIIERIKPIQSSVVS